MSCRFCNCTTGCCDQQQTREPVVTFHTPGSSSPMRSHSADRCTQTQMIPPPADSGFCCNSAAIRGSMHQSSKIYGNNHDRLGRQMSAGGGTTTDSVTFPRGDAFIAVDRRRASPEPNAELRGLVPNNIVRNTNHRRFVQSLRSPTSYACAPHHGAGGPGAMARDYPGPRVPDSLRRRESELQLAGKIRKNNAPATRSASTRARLASRAPGGPMTQGRMRPQSAQMPPCEGRRRYDPPSSGIAADVVASAPAAPAARDLYAADELQLRKHNGGYYSSSGGEDEFSGLSDTDLPLFHTGKVGSPAGLCPAVDSKKRAPWRGGSSGGGGGGYAPAPAAPAPAAAAAAPSTGAAAATSNSMHPHNVTGSALMEKRLRAADAPIAQSPANTGRGNNNNNNGAAVGGNKYQRAGVGALSPSTIKPTRLAFDPAQDEFVEAGGTDPDGSVMAAAANGVPLRRLYSLDQRPASGRQQKGQKQQPQPRRAQSAGGIGGRYSAVQRPGDSRAAANSSVVSSPPPASSPSRGARLNRAAAPGYPFGQPAVGNAADVAAWRRRYYPTAHEIQSSRRGPGGGFYQDPAAVGGSAAAAPPVCDRCCCSCCCTPGCSYARHKPGACQECLWWYN